LTGEPALNGLCHCRNCQRYTGSSFETVTVYPSASVAVQGELKTYNDVADSGKILYRRFCPNCGSGVMAEAEVMPGLIIVLAGTLDDPSAYTPSIELYCSSAQPWIDAGGERKRFDKMPT
jgi:hypothetical protein